MKEEIWIGLEAYKKNGNSDGNIDIDTALEIMTDEWIDNIQYCGQTVIDMRDIIKQYREKEKIEKMKDILK